MPDKLISIYHYVAAVDRKHYIMESFVQLIKSACNNDSNTDNLLIARELLTTKTKKYLEILKNAMLHSERGLYRCSQKKNAQIYPHYIELKGFKQTVVLNKRAHSAQNTCLLACSNINDEKLLISHADFSARREYCPGRLVNCKSGGDIELCRAVSGSSRLYEWIKTNLTGEIYGEFSECSGSIEIMKLYQYEAYSSFYCEPCICTCIQDTYYSPSRFGISLKEEIADIEKNEVITGIKFIEKNKIIYPQIETGKLLPDGHIQEFSNKWKPVNLINSMDNTLNIFPELNQQEYVYFGSSSKDVQYINLEQIYLTDEYIITGVKFIMVKQQSLYTKTDNNFISIAIQATHYDIKTGKLGKYPSNWMMFDLLKNKDPCRTYQYRRELIFPDSDNPLKYDEFDFNSINGDYVGFWPSSLKKDAGQTTIPLFDANPVFGIPRFPLGGIGLYHKGPINSGGFISLKIAGIDYFKSINTIIPSEDKIDFDSVLLSSNTN
ncbi:uncharacterized protein [Chelonus insularis]|uniref:uncharacterized protein n=1 Tax=Chelonus insularis TaxID=460826 RepID=UPI00158C7436|nr:uncharacterized protein LOC118071235 [Chelonus insularis]